MVRGAVFGRREKLLGSPAELLERNTLGTEGVGHSLIQSSCAVSDQRLQPQAEQWPWSTLALLHEMHIGWRFRRFSLPPLETGTRWSTSQAPRLPKRP